MKRLFYGFLAAFLMFLPLAELFAQQNVSAPQKYALVIGNGSYTGSGMSKLANPVNDANDVAATLQGLGFTVDKVLDASREQMESSIMRLKNRLSVSNETYGFFFYAGHGVQSGGENYLIPVGANIPSENSLRDRAVSVQWALAELNDAKNVLNVVVLDACRDNPFSWKRSGTRGLSVVANQPADSIIVYATSAGSTAADGTGRNGLFTTHLLNNLKQPGIEVKEIFNRTGADVARASNRTQIPAVYNQFFDTAYFGSRPTPNASVQPAALPVQPNQTYRIGDRGPAGGIVFYDKGQYTDGWRYMEAAPVDLGSSGWGGFSGKIIAGIETGIGSGKRNTELIIEALNRKSESGKAAQLCKAYILNGFSDWFLPSKDELNLIYTNLKQNSLGGFAREWYWSSSQGDYSAWGQRFNDGYQDTNATNRPNSVRAVRAF
jgi:hypothetical protein